MVYVLTYIPIQLYCIIKPWTPSIVICLIYSVYILQGLFYSDLELCRLDMCSSCTKEDVFSIVGLVFFSVPSVPPAPSNVTAMHPLLVRQNETQNLMGITRVQRGRQRGTCRFNPSTQMLHVNFPRQPNPPVILQR